MRSTYQNAQLIMQVAFLIMLCIAAVALVAYLGGFRGRATSHRVTLRVESTSGQATITYADPKQRVTGEGKVVNTPWERSVTSPVGEEIVLTAGNPLQYGTIECKILLDNKLWKQDSAKSPDDKVACGGIVP